jgi:hypothetical protein
VIVVVELYEWQDSSVKIQMMWGLISITATESATSEIVATRATLTSSRSTTKAEASVRIEGPVFYYNCTNTTRV